MRFPILTLIEILYFDSEEIAQHADHLIISQPIATPITPLSHQDIYSYHIKVNIIISILISSRTSLSLPFTNSYKDFPLYLLLANPSFNYFLEINFVYTNKFVILDENS